MMMMVKTTKIMMITTKTTVMGAMMTNQAPDRKLLQKVRTQTEQNERLLGRTMATVIATCGTIVGWMLIAKPAPVDAPAMSDMTAPVTPEAVAAAPVAPTLALVQLEYAPIPTVAAVPEAAPAPTLMPAPVLASGAGAPPPPAAVAAPAAAPANPAPAPAAPVAVDAMPALRVVAPPAAAPVAPQPATRPKPKPGGNTGGS
jgi:hypothetical protein